MPAFDTNVLIALIDEDHAQHQEAKQRFDGAQEVLLHPCIVAEFTTVVRRLAKDAGMDGNRAARDALQGLLAQPRVRIVNHMDHADAVQLYMAEPKLSFADAVLSEMRWGFDRQESVTFEPAIRASWKITEAQRLKRAQSTQEKGPLR